MEDEVGGFDELSHDGDDGQLDGLSTGEEGLVEGFEAGVVALGGEAGEVEHPPDAGPAAGDEAQALPLAAVAVEGGDAGEGGGLAPAHLSQLGHADGQAGGDDGTEAGDGEQQPEAGCKVLVGLEGLEHLGEQAGLEALQAGQLDLQAPQHVLERHVLEEGLEPGDLVGDLLIRRQPLGQFRKPGILRERLRQPPADALEGA